MTCDKLIEQANPRDSQSRPPASLPRGPRPAVKFAPCEPHLLESRLRNRYKQRVATQPPRKTKPKRVRKLAKKSARKAKEAGQFLYDHRKQILEGVELLGSVIAIVSTIMGKSGFRRRGKK